MKQYYNWEGSRKDLMSVIISLEKTDPKKYKMYSKKYKEYLTVTLRRLQQFTDMGILPSGENNSKHNTEKRSTLANELIVLKIVQFNL